MQVEEFDGQRWVQVIRPSRTVYVVAVVCTVIVSLSILGAGYGW